MAKAAEKAEAPLTGLALLRSPFPDHQISKLPKETKRQADERKKAQDAGRWPAKCNVCGGFHHEKAVHLDYVGHAALTDRLLDCDPAWSWEPVAFGPDGLPAVDRNGGMWIRLMVCGVTRLGYGSADGKSGGDAVKEVIGDALRNAAMRFGAALDLWHKGDLHGPEANEESERRDVGNAGLDFAIATMRTCRTKAEFSDFWAKNKGGLRSQLNDAEWAKVLRAKDEEVQRLLAADQPAASDDNPFAEAA